MRYLLQFEKDKSETEHLNNDNSEKGKLKKDNSTQNETGKGEL